MKKILKALLAIGLLSTSLPALSANMGFMYDSPIRHLTKEDWQMIDASTDSVLKTYPIHKKAFWKNPKSEHQGYIVALNKAHKDKMDCKDIKFYTETAYGNSTYKFTFCDYPSLGWKINSGH